MAELIGGWDANKLARFIDGRIPTTNPVNHKSVNDVSAFVKLTEVTLTAATATIDLSGITPEYNHLLVIGKIDNVTGAAGMDISFNGDTGANYGGEELSAVGVTLAGSENADGAGTPPRFAVSYNTANLFTSFIIFLPWYAKGPATGSRSFISLCYAHDGTHNQVRVFSGTWSKNTPIQRIELFTAGGANVKSGSAVNVYGIR